MANQYVNKFVKDGVTKFDLTGDTVTPETLAEGATAHDKSGALIMGEAQGLLQFGVNFHLMYSNGSIPDYIFYNNHADGTTSTNSSYPIIEAIIGGRTNGVNKIGSYAFRNCETLKKLTIGESIKTIYNGAFFGCKALEDVVIGNNVEQIRASAFSFCSNLTSITIPSSVTSVGDSVFYWCTGLTTITINKPSGSISGAPWGATNATVVWTG